MMMPKNVIVLCLLPICAALACTACGEGTAGPAAADGNGGADAVAAVDASMYGAGDTAPGRRSNSTVTDAGQSAANNDPHTAAADASQATSTPSSGGDAAVGGGPAMQPGVCVTADPKTLPICCPESDGRCAPKSAVNKALHGLLGKCDGGLCVPGKLFKVKTAFSAKPCASLGGKPGVCLPKCTPSVAPYAAMLPPDICSPGEVCTPCISPLDGKETGACGTFSCSVPAPANDADAGSPASTDAGSVSSADAGSTSPADAGGQPPTGNDATKPAVPVGTACCKGAGHCLPKLLVPADKQANLTAKGCDKKLQLCVPDIFTQADFKATACTGKLFFKYPYTGVCLPKCIKIKFDVFIWSGSCPKTDDCVPCVDPLTGTPTDAPGCPKTSAAPKTNGGS